MTDKNINLCDTEDEKQRYAFNMLPTHFITQMGANPNKLLKKTDNRFIYQPFQIVNVLNDSIFALFDTYTNAQDFHKNIIGIK